MGESWKKWRNITEPASSIHTLSILLKIEIEKKSEYGPQYIPLVVLKKINRDSVFSVTVDYCGYNHRTYLSSRQFIPVSTRVPSVQATAIQRNSSFEFLFQLQLSWKRMAEKDSDNYLALTGPLPDLNAWSAALSAPLNFSVKDWRPCELVS